MNISKQRRVVFAFMFCISAVFLTLGNSALACTTVIVGKEISADGSAYFGRTDDTRGTVGIHITTVPARLGEGSWTYEDSGMGLVAQLPVAGYQYFMTNTFKSAGKGIKGEAGGNEYGVYISATETLCASDAALAADPYAEKGVAESNIPTLILPYVKTAREGVVRLGEMIEQYGSSESNGVVIGDANETWYIEIYTGHQWAAVKCPDDKYAVIGNDAMLGYIDVNDNANVLTSRNLISLAEEKGFLTKIDGKFHLAATYNKGLRDYSQIRVWAGRRWFSPSDAREYDVNHRFNIFEPSEKKIELGEIMDLTRYRFEDTQYSCDIGGNNYRPIGIERTATTTIFQLRKDKPAVSWVSLANPEYSVFMPLYENINSIPESYEIDSTVYTPASAYWQFRAVSSLATLDRKNYGNEVRRTYKELETKWMHDLPKMDEAYIASGKSPEKAAELFASVSDEALMTAKSLQGKLLTKISQTVVQKSEAYGWDIEPASPGV